MELPLAKDDGLKDVAGHLGCTWSDPKASGIQSLVWRARWEATRNEDWKGWWGDNPPYHCPVFVLTHHARAPLEMEGGTTFHFVTGDIHEALDRARQAANGKDVRIGGGSNTIQQYLRAGLIDELHLAIAPVLLGTGERLFAGLDMRASGYECIQSVGSEKATHIVLRRKEQHDG